MVGSALIKTINEKIAALRKQNLQLDDFSIAVRELLTYVQPRYRSNGASRIFWEMLYEIAQGYHVRMESMNNVDAHLRHLFGGRVQQHIVSVVW